MSAADPHGVIAQQLSDSLTCLSIGFHESLRDAKREVMLLTAVAEDWEQEAGA